MTPNLLAVQRFSRSHSLISPQHAEELAGLAHSPVRDATSEQGVIQTLGGLYGVGPENRKPFPFAGGIAVIPVHGALLHRDSWASSWATGYDYIQTRFAAAMGDDDVKGIVFDVNSYGGHVSGNFELCEQIFDARGKKPMLAIVDSRSLSGGYSIASSVGRMIATPSADIGSIGVVMMHASWQKAMDDMGIKITFVFAGEHKVDGNPYEDLSDDVKAALQASVNKSYEQFVALVSKNRGLDAEVVRNTQARVYDADEAKTLGLIDDVMSPRAAIASFLTEVNTPSTTTKKVKAMSNEDQGVQTVDANKIAAEAATAERTRVAGILTCEEAQKRPKLATQIATTTSLSLDQAKALLSGAAEEKADAPASGAGPLATAMGGKRGTGVEGGDGEEEADGGQGMSRVDRIRSASAQARGTKRDSRNH